MPRFAAPEGLEAVAIVDEFLDALPADIAPATRDIAAAAASLRATHGSALRLPDGARGRNRPYPRADRIVTTDARWPLLQIAVDVVPTGA